MGNSVYDCIESSCKALSVDISAVEMAHYAEEHALSPEQLKSIADLFSYLKDKQHRASVETMLRLGRFPDKAPKTFENYDFSRIHGKDTDSLKNLACLTEVHVGKNIAFIGPPGVGKTHLAEAYGRACCEEGLKPYIIKATELKAKFENALKYCKEDSAIRGLVQPSCLIIDEIGRCTFNKECTRLFFDMVDRRYSKGAPNTMIMTSNKQPDQWAEYFQSSDDLSAALDRLFDEAKIITIKGDSYRGQNREIIAVEASQAINDNTN